MTLFKKAKPETSSIIMRGQFLGGSLDLTGVDPHQIIEEVTFERVRIIGVARAEFIGCGFTRGDGFQPEAKDGDIIFQHCRFISCVFDA